MIAVKEGLSMQDGSLPRQGIETSESCHDSVRGFVPSIDTREVFRRLIADELRSGRLTPSRRRRIVRFAAHLGLSAVQVGRLITACREETLRSADANERRHALRLVEPAPTRVPTHFKIALVVAGAILLDLLVLKWLW
jgi:hypothetical protein